MKHPIYRIKSVEQAGTFILKIHFDDGVFRTINFEPVLKGELLGSLMDPSVFAQFFIDPEGHTLAWPTGADFDPAVLHDWPEHEAAYIAAAKSWSESTARA